MATLTPAELSIVRSHGLRPIAAVAATCWLHYGWSWTEGHAQGWETALKRLGDEAKACGANAVLDVKMRTIGVPLGESMDYSLVGTAVKVDGLPASSAPIIATVPALEFVKLLEADVVPTGIAIGAHYEWLSDWRGYGANPNVWFNVGGNATLQLDGQRASAERIWLYANPPVTSATACWRTSIFPRCSKSNANRTSKNIRNISPAISSSPPRSMPAAARRSRMISKWSWTCTPAKRLWRSQSLTTNPMPPTKKKAQYDA